MKGWLVNLLLGALLLIGAIWLNWDDEQRQELRLQEEASRRLTPWNASELSRLVFTDAQGHGVTVERRDANWQLTRPLSAVADPEAVRRLAALAEAHYDREVAPAGAALDDFGLGGTPPRLELHTADNQTRTLILGGDTPVGGRRYVKWDPAGSVVTLPRRDVLALDMASSDLRDRTLFPGTRSADVQTVIRSHGDETLTLLREGDGWRLAAPMEERADSLRTDSWLGLLLSSRGRGFRSQAPTGSPAWSLTLRLEGKSLDPLKIWQDGESLLVQRPGETDWLELDARELAGELDKSFLDLVDTRPLGRDAAPTRLTLASGERRVEARRGASGWPDAAWDSLAQLLDGPAWQALRPEHPKPTPRWTLTTGEPGAEHTLSLAQDERGVLIMPPQRWVWLLWSEFQTQRFVELTEKLLGTP
ncbi:MAG: DUF4340 domain-containing protein [Magnetococcus sp. WYHC-3]